MTDLLNKLPQFIENKENNTLLQPIIYPTAWGKWCIAYKELAFDPANKPKKIFAVVIEPDKDPVRIEDTIGYMNEYIGNAPSFEEAITMVLDYINKYYTIK